MKSRIDWSSTPPGVLSASARMGALTAGLTFSGALLVRAQVEAGAPTVEVGGVPLSAILDSMTDKACPRTLAVLLGCKAMRGHLDHLRGLGGALSETVFEGWLGTVMAPGEHKGSPHEQREPTTPI